MKLPFFLAKRFVAGESFEQAAPQVWKLNRKRIRITLDLLGENVTDRQVAEQTLEEYKQLLRKINQKELYSSISIKPTMMGLDIDYGFCRDNLFDLLETARDENQFVRIDMEGSTYTQQILDLFEEAFKQYGHHVGIVIQAYLHRTEQDIARLCELGADVRLCKGAYNESGDVALQEMPAIREAFKTYTRSLLEHTPFPRIATHDDELIEWTKSYTRENGIDQERFEFQMLYGMRQPTWEQLVEEGYYVRIYVPYGTMWLPYFTRRLTERKENIWFVLSTLFKR